VIEPYDTYIPYEVYIIPGLACMILLFNGMQGSLSMVYDREMGSMRVLLTSPVAAHVFAVQQVARHRADFAVAGVRVPGDRLGLRRATTSHGAVDRPAGLAAGGLDAERAGLLLSNAIRQLENFAGVMNFVIFPLFFISSALYPLWKMRDSSELVVLAVRQSTPSPTPSSWCCFALYERFAGLALAVCLGLTVLFAVLAVLTFNPQHAALRKKG